MNIKDLQPGSYTLHNPAANQDTIPQASKQKDLGQTIEGGLDAVFGGNQIGQSLVKAGTNLKNLATGGIQKFEQNLPQNTVNVPQLAGDYLKAGSNFIPGAGEGTNLATKTAVGAGTGYAMDVGSNLKNKESAPFTPGAGTAIAGALPIAGAVVKPGVAILGRLLKGVGSGLSGVPVHQIEQIFNNPEAATRATQQIAKAGKSQLLEDNAKTIVNGVSKVRQEARGEYGKALGALKAEDINPQTFRQAIQPVLDKVGSVLDTKTNTRILNNIEFDQPKNIAKASSLIDELSKTDLDGLSLRNLSNKIEDAKYKTTGGDAERLSFNAFLNDLDSGLKGAINSSTDKLQEMNQKFSSDMQLAEATQGIFGKVKFKNLNEVNRASQKLEALFSQKGMSPDITNNFLKRIGVDPEGFKASEAVRQLEGKEAGANSVGLSLGEITRGITSSVVTPEAVGAISARIGATKETLEPFLKSLPLPTRNLVVQALLQVQANNRQQEAPGMPTQ